ncbi:prepilin-type N-terminal cleavage/methylation domain-containing protein [uncultured Robinsoniella sp.]|uniref:prepilin-type N-terminal cleavage/methylation domain-containing protein n=1 Tax=uncultured Robinsoniella sp. TaxID=904190 RepID=UPI00374E6A72
MFAKIKRTLKQTKGFTLLEMISVITVVAIIGTIVTIAVYGYMVTAYMLKANQTAETVFYAAQSYLTQQKDMGALDQFNERIATYDTGFNTARMEDILQLNGYFPDDDPTVKEEWEKNHSSSKIVSVFVNSKNGYLGNREDMSSKDDYMYFYNPFWTEIIEPSIKDENITDHCFLLEYDKTTGIVISVFYSEKIENFCRKPDIYPYELNGSEKYNVVKRDTKSLKENRQGYYGISMSNYANSTVEVYQPAVKLVNSDRLYLEWQDKNLPLEGAGAETGNPAFSADSSLAGKLYYDVKIKSKNRPDFSISLGKVKAGVGTPVDWKTAEEKAGTSTSSSEPIFIYDSSNNTYSLSLDCIHYSILEKYKGILSTDYIYCEVTPKLEGMSVSDQKGVSNYESANFGGGEKEADYNGVMVDAGGSGKLETGLEENESTSDSPYTIKYARHLNNMRNVTAASYFLQTGDINWKSPEYNNDSSHTVMLSKKLFEPLVFVKEVKTDQNDLTNLVSEFKGQYAVAETTDEDNQKRNFQITGIDIKADAKIGNNVGLFAINGGEIKGLRLLDTSVSGVTNVGAVTGTNNETGKITDVQVQAAVQAKNSNSSNGESGSTVANFGKNIGGAIGENKGTVSNVTTLPVVDSDKKATQNVVSGNYNVGGVIGLNHSNQVSSLKNYNNLGIVTDGDGAIQNFGGIAGQNDNAGKLADCINKGIISLSNKNEQPDGDGALSREPLYIGGIVGYNEGSLNKCENVLDETYFTKSDKLFETCLKDLNKADGALPSYLGKCVGGIAGGNLGNNAKVTDCFVNNAVLGKDFVGGLIGVNMGTVTNGGLISTILENVTGRKEDVSGLVIGSGNMVGGIFGYTYAENAEISNYVNASNVLGASMVGGIVGMNGADFNSVQKLLDADWNGQLDELASGTDEYYKKLMQKDLSDAERSNIENALLNYYSKLMQGGLAAEHTNAASKITSCTNTGFVYAVKRYSGGITGVNFGELNKCLSSYEETEDGIIDAKYDFLTTADCAGGIAGLNLGSVIGDGANNADTSNYVYGNSFVGGIVGWNVSSISGYRNVSGCVRGRNNYVGGYLGMNSHISGINGVEVTYNGGTDSQISGKNYVGGLIGCNIVPVKENNQSEVQITGATSGNVSIKGEAYVGGIIGYHSSVEDLNNVPIQCASLTAYYPYGVFDANASQEQGGVQKIITNFVSCRNTASVTGSRYVGGIIGCNEKGSNLTVTSSNNYGDISIAIPDGIQIDEDAATSDQITGTSYFIGGITGRNTSTGLIQQCYNEGSVKSPSKYLGGLCEVNEGIIKKCTIGDAKSFKIEGRSSVGGIVGLNHTTDPSKPARVEDCSANQYASIVGGSNTGGLVGTNEASIINCTTYANVSAKDGDKVGGITGFNKGSISGTAIGSERIIPTVVGRNYVGGLIGVNEGILLQEGTNSDSTSQGVQPTLENLVNRANVTGENYVGGIVGSHNSKSIKSCSNYGNITSEKRDASDNIIGSGYAGGITGINESGKAISDCQNYGNVTSNYGQSGGIVGMNLGTLQSCSNSSGTIRSDYAQAGGITGINSGIIQESINLGSVTGAVTGTERNAIGGIAGINNGASQGITAGEIKNCTSKLNSSNSNSITGSNILGGIIGWNQGTVTMKKNSGEDNNVTINMNVNQAAVNSTAGNIPLIGGIIGKDDRSATDKNPVSIENYIYSGTIQISEMAQTLYAGGIIGYNNKSHIVKNCEFRGTISGLGNRNFDDKGNLKTDGGVGGITGRNAGTIYLNRIGDSNEYAINTTPDTRTSISGCTNVGGIVGIGDKNSSILRDAPNNGNAKEGYILNYASVTGVLNAGGIYGNSSVAISECKNKGIIGGKTRIGGISGIQNSSADITDCENTSQAMINPLQENSSDIGGIAGYAANVKITNSSNQGKICYANESSQPAGITNVGGIVGNGSSTTFINCTNGTAGETRDFLTCDVRNAGGIVGNYAGPKPGKDVKNFEDLKTLAKNFDSCNNYMDIVMNGELCGSVGGIVGNASGNDLYLILNSCDNYGKIKMNANKKLDIYNYTYCGMGGIVGYATTKVYINDCNNYGVVDANNFAQVGGIIGVIKSKSNAVSVGLIENSNNHTTGTIKGGGDVGGIIGRQEDGAYLKVQNNDNSGSIYGIQNVGGILGRIYQGTSSAINSGEYRDCTNKGSVSAIWNQEANATPSGIGGCVGAMPYAGELFTNLINEGELSVDKSAGTKTVTGVGGIVGVLGNTSNSNSTFKNCSNKKDLNLDRTDIRINSLGGIAGSMASPAGTALNGCTNYASVISNDSSVNVGGIVGALSSGTITACSTQIPQGSAVPVIQGGQRVGGIAGYVSGVATKVMSDIKIDPDNESKQFRATYNTFHVTADKEAGGIVGELAGSAILSVYNTGNVSVKRVAASELSNVNSAGGIVGYANDASTLNKGIVINCYSLGRIGWSDTKAATKDEVCGYIGGIIGARRYTGNSSDLRDKICTGASMRDCYFINDRVASTLPYLKLGNTSLQFHKWMVGNEPFAKYNTDNGDSQSYTQKDDAGEKGYWNEASFDALLDTIGKTDDFTWDKNEELTNVNNILQNYFYELPIPDTKEVTGVMGTTYEMKWKGLVGLTSGYDVSIFTNYEYVDGIKTGKGSAIWSQHYDSNNLEGLTLNLKSIASKYMGQKLYLSIQAKGYSIGEGENKIDITTDSKTSIVQTFVMMPPLPTLEVPEKMEIQQESNSSKVTLSIKNINEYYTKSPYSVYPGLQELSQGKLLEANLYDMFKNGTAKIKVIDYFLNNENESYFQWHSNEHEMNINWDTGEATLTIDYSQPGEKYENKFWHAYLVQICISDQQNSMSLNPESYPDNTVKYRYLSSDTEEKRFLLSTTTNLTSPKGLEKTYTGTTTEPAYSLTWQNPNESKENVRGYKVVITNPVTGASIEKELLKTEALRYDLTSEDIKKLMGDDYPNPETINHTLNWSVTALSGSSAEDKVFYKDSDPAADTITLPLMEDPVNSVAGSIPSEVYYPYMVDFNWKDSTYSANTKYEFKLTVTSEGKDVTKEASLNYSSGTTCQVDLPKALDADYNIELTVKKVGNIGQTLDSAVSIGKLTVKKSLPAVANLSHSEPQIDPEDSTKIKVNLEWKIPDGVNETNCSGYLFAILPVDELQMDNAITTVVNGWDTVKTELKFDTSSIGNDYFIYAYALGVQDVSSTSIGRSISMVLPNDRLTKPVLKGEIQHADGVVIPPEDGCGRDEYATLKYVFSWKNDKNELNKIKGCRIRLFNDEGTLIPLNGKDYLDITDSGVIAEEASYTLTNDLSGYAGKTLSISIVKLSSSITALASEAGVLQFTVPKTKLKSPENIQAEIQMSDGTSAGDSCTQAELANLTYVFNWDNNQIDSGKIKGHKFVLMDGNEEINFNNGDYVLDGEATSNTIKMDLSAYAGKTLEMKIINIPTDENELSSDAGSVAISIPILAQVKSNLQTEAYTPPLDMDLESERETETAKKDVRAETEINKKAEPSTNAETNARANTDAGNNG